MRLGPKARILLDLLLMTGSDALEAIARPRISALDAAGWDSEKNFYRLLTKLRDQGWIDWEGDSKDQSWVFRITEDGKETLLEKIDPEASWAHRWDGKWRALSFDLPQNARKERRRLDTWLRKKRFGHLQGSVWISHRPYSDWSVELEKLEVDPHSALFQECVLLGGNKDADYVTAAWDFNSINEYYKDHISFLDSSSPFDPKENHRLSSWLFEESALWNKAFRLDPFLPESLLPSPYLGKIGWAARRKAYQNLDKVLRGSLAPPHRRRVSGHSFR